MCHQLFSLFVAGNPGRILLLFGISVETTEAEIQTVYPTALRVYIPRCSNNKNKCYAYVTFATVEEAEKQLSECGECSIGEDMCTLMALERTKPNNYQEFFNILTLDRLQFYEWNRAVHPGTPAYSYWEGLLRLAAFFLYWTIDKHTDKRKMEQYVNDIRHKLSMARINCGSTSDKKASEERKRKHHKPRREESETVYSKQPRVQLLPGAVPTSIYGAGVRLMAPVYSYGAQQASYGAQQASQPRFYMPAQQGQRPVMYSRAPGAMSYQTPAMAMRAQSTMTLGGPGYTGAMSTVTMRAPGGMAVRQQKTVAVRSPGAMSYQTQVTDMRLGPDGQPRVTQLQQRAAWPGPRPAHLLPNPGERGHPAQPRHSAAQMHMASYQQAQAQQAHMHAQQAHMQGMQAPQAGGMNAAQLVMGMVNILRGANQGQPRGYGVMRQPYYRR